MEVWSHKLLPNDSLKQRHIDCSTWIALSTSKTTISFGNGQSGCNVHRCFSSVKVAENAQQRKYRTNQNIFCRIRLCQRDERQTYLFISDKRKVNLEKKENLSVPRVPACVCCHINSAPARFRSRRTSFSSCHQFYSNRDHVIVIDIAVRDHVVHQTRKLTHAHGTNSWGRYLIWTPQRCSLWSCTLTFSNGEEEGSVVSLTDVVSESKRSYRMVLFFSILDWEECATLNLPTCHWLGCSRALKPRRSGSSAALIDEPGRDGHRTPGPSLVLRWKAICAKSWISNALSAKLNEELGISSDITRGMTPSTALREESWSGSLARGRPHTIPRDFA